MTDLAFHIRPATAHDDATIKRMVRSEGLDPTSLDWRHFLVAEHEGTGDGTPRIVGIGQVKEYPGCQELGSLVVLPEYRRHGLAGQLIAALEARAGRPLYLLCRDRLQPFYERFGYQRLPMRQAPFPLLLKMLAARLLLLFGIRVVLMWKA